MEKLRKAEQDKEEILKRPNKILSVFVTFDTKRARNLVY
jgi:hypothetical protein